MRRGWLAVLVLLLVCTPLVPRPAFAAGAVWHIVRPGETLSGIAEQWSLDPDDLAGWNQIADPYPVYPDEVLRLNPPPYRLPAWQTRIEEVTPDMIGWDPRRGCPVAPRYLRKVWVSYLDFTGAYHDGSIIVRQDIAENTQHVFQTLYRMRFRIMAMAPMSINMPGETNMGIVTAGWNCRPVAGTKTWSQHAYGLAIDINPLQNPMLRGRSVAPAAAAYYLNRERWQIGMLHPEGAVRAFTANGFAWGGMWRSLKDYMHFSTTNL